MEKYIQDIELINRFINNELNTDEDTNFQNRIKTDTEFNAIYNEHLSFLEGLKRIEIKQDIHKAERYYEYLKSIKYIGLSILVISSLFLLLNWINSNKIEDTLKSKLNFEHEFIQKFRVPIDTIISIKGEKGTIVDFNLKDLQTSSGSKIKGDSLIIELIELTSKQDLLFANVQTVSNGDWLESGGSFKITIKNMNNEELTLREGKTITIRFPKVTSESDMQLFYGKRDKKGYMNWQAGNKAFVEEKPYVIFYKDTTVLDEYNTRIFRVDTYRDIIITDTIGYMANNQIKSEFPELENIIIEEDTLRVYEEKKYKFNQEEIESLYENDSIFSIGKGYEIIYSSIDNITINKKLNQIDDRNLKNKKYLEKIDVFNTEIKGFYKSIEVSNLGWLNIDKYSETERELSVKLITNIDEIYKEVFLIDETRNSVFNYWFDQGGKIVLLHNVKFKIICIAFDGEDFYAYKNSVKFVRDRTFRINLQKIKENQIKSFLKL